MKKIDEAYLGDGVYAYKYDYYVELTTENGIEITNSIILEPEVANNLIKFLKGGL
jgi:hypothetical protein